MSFYYKRKKFLSLYFCYNTGNKKNVFSNKCRNKGNNITSCLARYTNSTLV